MHIFRCGDDLPNLLGLCVFFQNMARGLLTRGPLAIVKSLREWQRGPLTERSVGVSNPLGSSGEGLCGSCPVDSLITPISSYTADGCSGTEPGVLGGHRVKSVDGGQVTPVVGPGRNTMGRVKGRKKRRLARDLRLTETVLSSRGECSPCSCKGLGDEDGDIHYISTYKIHKCAN